MLEVDVRESVCGIIVVKVVTEYLYYHLLNDSNFIFNCIHAQFLFNFFIYLLKMASSQKLLDYYSAQIEKIKTSPKFQKLYSNFKSQQSEKSYNKLTEYLR